MPFLRPTLTQLREQAVDDINAGLPGADALLRYSNMSIVGSVLAAMTSGHYEYADWIARQSTPFTCTDEFLEGWAGLKGVTRKAATRAHGQVTFPATNGANVAQGTILTRSDGVAYVVSSLAIAAENAVTVAVNASAPGAQGNCPDTTTFSISTGVSGVSARGAARGVISGGADVEPDDLLRTRMLAAYATPPQGGALTDYPIWAGEVPGVTRSWPRPGGMGPGTIVLFFMMDAAQAANGGFPQGTNGVAGLEARDTAATGDQLTVANAIFPRQPATALVYAVAPIPNRIGLTINGLPATGTETRAAIIAAVSSAIQTGASPGGQTNLATIIGAVASIDGTGGFVIVGVTASAGAVIGGGPTGNISSNAGALPVLGTIAFP